MKPEVMKLIEGLKGSMYLDYTIHSAHGTINNIKVYDKLSNGVSFVTIAVEGLPFIRFTEYVTDIATGIRITDEVVKILKGVYLGGTE